MTAAWRATVDTDELLQDSYLLTVQLRQRGRADENNCLKDECIKQVEHVRSALKNANVSQRSIDLISHAQCALLDETVLGCTEGEFRSPWESEPLQARFFQEHQAGDRVYENIQELLSEPAPDPLVATVFQRVLLLGFKGRYSTEQDPARAQILAALNALVAPLDLALARSHAGEIAKPARAARWLRAPWVHLLGAGLLLVGLWVGLDHLLGNAIDTLVLEQVRP